MIEIALLSILGLAAGAYTVLWVRTRKRDALAKGEDARLSALIWENEMRRKQHEEFNKEFLDSLTDEDRARFLREWKGES